MAKVAKKLEWCIVRLGDDVNWWVEEISDPVHWDIDGLGIVDPRQMNYIVDHLDLVAQYGFPVELLESAFIKFAIDKDLGKGRIRLTRTAGSFLAQDEVLFALPDVVDEERSPYADFIHQLTKARVKMLNDLIEFESTFTIDELEDEIRDAQNAALMEGRATHVFTEIMSILDYIPEGYELDLEDEKASDKDYIGEDFPDVEEEEEESIEEDETMKWDDDDDYDEEDDDSDEDDLDDEDDDEDDEPAPKSKKVAKPTKKPLPPKPDNKKSTPAKKGKKK